jgi:hypothetical protein
MDHPVATTEGMATILPTLTNIKAKVTSTQAVISHLGDDMLLVIMIL